MCPIIFVQVGIDITLECVHVRLALLQGLIFLWFTHARIKKFRQGSPVPVLLRKLIIKLKVGNHRPASETSIDGVSMAGQ